MKLRDYQERALSDLRAVYASGKRAPCLVLPTGAGKTVVASAIIAGALAKRRRSLFLAHRVELIDQSVAKLAACGITNVRMIRAEHDVGPPNAPVTVASVQTLSTPRWLDKLPDADLVVMDEVHHVKAASWTRLAQSYASAHLLGLTATPQRGDGGALGDILDALVIGATVKELTALGHLVPCRVWAPPMALGTGEIALDVVDAYRQHARGERAVIFCSTVEHALSVAAALTAAGIPTGIVTGNLRGRGETLAAWRRGELRCVANVHVLTEGFDDPPLGVAIMARKPVHVGTLLQCAGRVLRSSPGKTQATLVDLCGSVHLHGTPDADREYSLDGKGISSATREPIRQCPTCGSVFLAASTCPHCGAEMPVRAFRPPSATGDDLVEVPSSPARPPMTIAITAKYASRCTRCTGRINVGERIYWTKGSKPRHAQCGQIGAAA